MALRASVAGVLCLLFLVARSAFADDWLPIPPGDLQMTSEPQAPGAQAIILYRQVDRSDRQPVSETEYIRIKILTPEGRRYANVEIPFFKGLQSIESIEARTVHPDGRIVRFDGTVFEKPVVETRDAQALMKTFALPAVDVGSIIEYRYRRRMHGLFNSQWIISQNLFTRNAKFTLEPSSWATLRWSWPRDLPGGALPEKAKGKPIRLDVSDVPALVAEDLMPPLDWLRYQVDFIYDPSNVRATETGAYWKELGDRYRERVERFCQLGGWRDTINRELSQIALPSDSPEQKLRKIYARVQQLRNLNYEPLVEREAAGNEGPNQIRDAADVLRKGYGASDQIAYTFMALARAAGFDAEPALVVTRDRHFFDPRSKNPTWIDNVIIIINLSGREQYLAPNVPFAPFGSLPWHETGATALRIEREGSKWFLTPMTLASDAELERTARLRLDANTLKGTVTVTYKGLQAMSRRIDMRSLDDTGRRQFLEQDLRRVLPASAEVKLTNSPDWSAAEAPLVAEYELDIPGWSTPIGRRSAIAAGLFGRAEQHLFEHETRVNPIYFYYPYLEQDEISIELPEGWKIDSVPAARSLDLPKLHYRGEIRVQGHSLQITRQISQGFTLIDVEQYDTLRQFFSAVRAGDADQALLSSVSAARN